MSINMNKIISESRGSNKAFVGAFVTILIIIAGVATLCLGTGCATITKILTGATNITQKASSTVTKINDKFEYVTQPAKTNKTTSAKASVDAVPFDSLVWDSGGFKPASGTIIKGNISSVAFNGGTLTYSATVDADWGSEGNAPNGTIAALFFKGSDGAWRGGKFDWIGFVGKPRPAGHIAEYNGWAHAFPATKGEEYAYVLIRGDNKRYRTNVVKGVVK